MNVQQLSRFAMAVLLVVTALTATPVAAKEEPPPGLLVASVGDTVILADPVSGGSTVIRSGPVGWLYPAPGGVLFAPDLVNGVTTVIDLRTRQVLERLQGVTMPVFGGSPDRYVVAAREVLVVSYPERAFIASIPAEIASPWQSIVTDDDGVLFTLERRPDGDSCTLVAVDLLNRQVVYRKRLGAGVARMALSRQLSLLALAEQEADRVDLVTPAALSLQLSFRLVGPPQDVAFFGEQGLAIAVDRDGDVGELRLVQLKPDRKGPLKIKKDHSVPLSGSPQRLAVGPWQRRLAVSLSDGRIEIVLPDKPELLGTVVLPAAPRDLVWCDPAAEGPLLPEWSDRRAAGPELELGFPPEAEIAGGSRH